MPPKKITQQGLNGFSYWIGVPILLLCMSAFACSVFAVVYVMQRPPPIVQACPVQVCPIAPIAQTTTPAVRVVMDPNAGGAPPGTYPQIGYIKGGEGPAVALYGAQSANRRGRWNYYVIPSGGVKLPIVLSGRDCMDEIGCDMLVDGDRVSVPDAGGVDGIAKIYNTNNPPKVLL